MYVFNPFELSVDVHMSIIYPGIAVPQIVFVTSSNWSPGKITIPTSTKMPFMRPAWLDRLNKKTQKLLTHNSVATKIEDKPREAPPSATPVQLPQYPHGCLNNVPYTADEIYRLFSTLQKPGPNKRHLEALNVHVVADVALEQLIPNGYIPPTSWLADPATSGGSNAFPAPIPPPNEKLRNGAYKPKHEDFYSRVKELMVNNDDAFCSLQRKPPPQGRPAIKLAHFRKMWDSLSDIAGYWDTSLDRYITTEPEAAAMDVDQIRAEVKAVNKGDTQKSTSKTPKVEYTGRRISNGEHMPPMFREHTIAAFVETIVWCFRCRVEQPRIAPKLRFHQMMFGILQSNSVYCTPEDQQQARKGLRQGPVMGIQCRPNFEFRKPNEIPGETKDEIRDLLHEVSLGLSMAQKRDREGKEEDKYWEGKWWCTVPRFGGAPERPAGDDDDEEMKDEAKADGKESESDNKTDPSASARKKQKLSGARAKWSAAPPPSSQYEKNVVYQHVGKVKGANYDDIYLISSLTHHLSILHLRVPSAYSAYLTLHHPPSPDFVPSQHPWYKIEVRRSRWFDLLDAADRVEAMRGIWGVVGWLMRGKGK